ncbi:segregation and condensation protein B (plasmid) [Legionella adelaidensis]|uniref:Segregation and condensation protein B n=1 Tax=Legionella adelaidensis TaxID=45056 RepID=A0A0W0R4G3_9GAMM|nr:SMC-Scp complex subunit ScpB [Legionella adelaidensis]KTC65929.1 segregation and condensation protein B [Legionella adelaidensis]VEH85549.1 segregation and condensation protein B [Legionella adelaidensis]
MNDEELKLILEALLMTSNQPLSLEKIESVFEEWERPSREQLQKALNILEGDYQHRAIELKRLPTGYCLQTKVRFSPWISKLLAEKPSKYSRAFLETLAIIAYKQPVTRADIEEIRGVSISTGILKTLLEREWIKVAGVRDVPGKPSVYTTTKYFLEYFNLGSLDELPPLMGENFNLFAVPEAKDNELVVNDA